MRTIVCITTVTFLIFSGCATTRSDRNRVGVDLIEQTADIAWVNIHTREWKGLLGVHGFVGFQDRAYRAKLIGPGPVFIDPPFQDNPSDIRCVGTIELNRVKNEVTINMRRVVESPGGTKQQTSRHPANGIYEILSIRKAFPNEFNYIEASRSEN